MNEKPKYRADIGALNENVWSNNSMEYDSYEEVKSWLDDLSMRWFGYDLSRIVTIDTPKNEPIDFNGEFYQKFRSGL